MTDCQNHIVRVSINGDAALGLLHTGSESADTGVLFVVGGPQYRVGSHRQFVIMARRISSAGYPVFRFDFLGMGDSDGDSCSFENIKDDIRSAIDGFIQSNPGLDRVVLLGLCDAASANLMYCTDDVRVSGLISLNPWVRTPQSEAKSYLRHYYGQRLLQKSFWQKVFSGGFDYVGSIKSLIASIRAGREVAVSDKSEDGNLGSSFLDQMRYGITNYLGPVCFIISGQDLTAQEFVDLCRDDRRWKRVLSQPNITLYGLPDADHTMTSRVDLDRATDICIGWLREHF